MVPDYGQDGTRRVLPVLRQLDAKRERSVQAMQEEVGRMRYKHFTIDVTDPAEILTEICDCLPSEVCGEQCPICEAIGLDAQDCGSTNYERWRNILEGKQ